MSNGMWKCGTDQSGVQYKVDPAPWRVKHRFCTPHGIQEILRPYGAEHLHKKECSENVNFDFESKGVRRLKSIYVYTPRALVTVEDEDSFGNRTKHIRCAYEDGVPQVSSEFNFGGGPYRGGAVWDAEIVALAWGKDPLRDCWVRTQSQSQSVHGGFCGLSMTIPGTFQEKARGDMHFMSILFYSCTIFNVLLFTTVGYIFWSRILKGVKKGLKRLRKAIERMLKALRRKLRSACTQSSESSEEENLIGT